MEPNIKSVLMNALECLTEKANLVTAAFPNNTVCVGHYQESYQMHRDIHHTS